MSDKTITQENIDAATSTLKQNVKRLHEAAMTDRERLHGALERIASLERTLTMQQNTIQQLQQQVTTMLAASYGRGGTR